MMTVSSWLRNRVKVSELSIFTYQFACMIDAGVGVVKCLEILKVNAVNPYIASIANQLRNSVAEGTNLSNALKRYPDVFDKLYITLVKSLKLELVLGRLARHLEKTDKFRRQLRNALIYPAVVLVTLIVVLIIMLWKVIPLFEKMYGEYGLALPGPTLFLVNICRMVVDNIAIIWMTLFSVVIGGFALVRLPACRYKIDGLLLKLPPFKNLVRAYAATHALGTLNLMLNANIPLVRGLKHSAKVMGNQVVRDALLRAHDRIQQGMALDRALAERGIFPDKAIQLVRVGAMTASLPMMLAKVSEFYEEELDRKVKAQLMIFEQLLYILLGLLCGGLMVAMYMPIFEVAGVVNTK